MGSHLVCPLQANGGALHETDISNVGHAISVERNISANLAAISSRMHVSMRLEFPARPVSCSARPTKDHRVVIVL